tara:strand:- start:216 stop:521 length:306 start_codon:yes stop_codon:yes gene_type:complete
MPAKHNRHGGDLVGAGVILDDSSNTNANTVAAAANIPSGPWGMIIPLGTVNPVVTLTSDRIAGTLSGVSISVPTPIDASNVVCTSGDCFVQYALDPKTATS